MSELLYIEKHLKQSAYVRSLVESGDYVACLLWGHLFDVLPEE